MSVPGPEALRLFTAIDLPPESKAQLVELLQRLQKGMQFTGAHPTWVTSENLHITLAFLGNQNPDQVPIIENAMRAATGVTRPFELRLSGLELFPTPREPRVISVAIKGEVERLNNVYVALTDGLRSSGFQIDKRPFRAHLTVARIKSVKGLAGLRSVVNSHANYIGTQFIAQATTLYKSTLTPAGSIYEPLCSIPLSETEPSVPNQ
ncbi:MAG: RNA 2',3'-cyclic phosphodiesterase [Candidatus Sumerlaeaceae bacterium]